jgi:hypothetical protein
MPDPQPGFVQQYRQAIVTAVVMIVLFAVIYYLLPAGMVSFLYK